MNSYIDEIVAMIACVDSQLTDEDRSERAVIQQGAA